MANDAKKTPVTAAPKAEVKAAVAVKKTAEKKTAEKKTAAKKTAVKKADTKKTAAKKTTAKKPVDSKVYIQFYGKQITASDVAASCEADYKANNKAAIKSIDIYVKPEEDTAYYVVNGKVEGKVSL